MGGIATFVNGLAVSGGTPARSVSEFIAWVRDLECGIDLLGPANYRWLG